MIVPNTTPNIFAFGLSPVYPGTGIAISAIPIGNRSFVVGFLYMKIKDGVKIFIKNPKLNKYLFMLRDNKPAIPNPNVWGLLGGGIEDGEAPKEALLRELQEEVNIDIYDIKYLGNKPVEILFKGKKHDVTGHYFMGLTNALLDEIHLTEGQKVKYFTLDEIHTTKNMFKGNIKLLNKYKLSLT